MGLDVWHLPLNHHHSFQTESRRARLPVTHFGHLKKKKSATGIEGGKCTVIFFTYSSGVRDTNGYSNRLVYLRTWEFASALTRIQPMMAYCY